MARRGARRGRQTKRTSSPAPAPAAPKGDRGDELTKPTEEQMKRVEYKPGQIRDEMGAQIGFAYRRNPLFETMFRGSSAITLDEIAALRFYRGAFDRCERSQTKSCLNFGGGGGGLQPDPSGGMIAMSPAIVEAKRKVALCEAGLGHCLSVVRAVALHDMSFSEIAIERFGGRRRDWIVADAALIPPDANLKPSRRAGGSAADKVQIVPKSGRHREAIRQEFIAGLRLLTKQVRSLVSMPGIEEVWVSPGKSSATIRRGVAAPNGLYRLWGDSARVDDMMSRLREAHGDDLTFPTAAAARVALDAADGGRLARLNMDELAA